MSQNSIEVFENNDEPLNIGEEPDHVRGIPDGPLSIKANHFVPSAQNDTAMELCYRALFVTALMAILCLYVASGLGLFVLTSTPPCRELYTLSVIYICFSLAFLCAMAASLLLYEAWLYWREESAHV